MVTPNESWFGNQRGSMPRSFRVFLVEDSLTDAHVLERAFRETRIDHVLTHCVDGPEALRNLRALQPGDRPDLVLLDLNLPGMDGHEVLERIKADPGLKTLPVVILSTSRLDEEVGRAYQSGANSYITKPGDFAGYQDLVQALTLYWRDTVVSAPAIAP